VSDLELALTELGRRLELPPTPDLAAAVLPRLGSEPVRPRRRLPVRRPVVLAFAAALLLAASAVAAVPGLRHAVLDAFGIRGVEVHRAPLLPPAPAAVDEGSLHLGARTTEAAAARRARFRLLVPAALGAPDAVRVRRAGGGAFVSLVYRRDGGVRWLLGETRGAGSQRFLLKTVGPGTAVRHVRVGAAPGAWITGRPHDLVFLDARGQVIADTVRLAGDVLLWERAGLVLRLEGARSLGEALRIARSMK
jgi:hypothetical protein